MSDVSFPCRPSSSAGNRGATVCHSSTVDTSHPGKDCADNKNVSVVEGSQTESTFSAPGEEASVSVGTKRARDLGESEDNHSSALTTGEVCFDGEPISTIVAGAKRLRISDKAADERDNELRHSLILDRHQDEQEPVFQASVIQTIIILETPSLSGLSEELIIEITNGLTLPDIMALRMTNRRLAYVTRARVLWIIRLRQLLDHLAFAKSSAAFLPAQLSLRALEHVVVRPHIFYHKWLRSIACHQIPIKSRTLSTNWSEPEDIRLPILMPGGRWLIATCDDGRFSKSSICLWDLDHGTLKWLPDAQMDAEGRVRSLDMKMDRKGSFAFLAVLSNNEDVAAVADRVDVYQVVFKTDAGASSFHQVDSFPLGTRRASEVQIYPQHGRVIVDMFDRVLLWDYAPVNMCAWMRTSEKRRLFHRSAHAITHTHRYLLVADGDESALRVFNIPPPLLRPAQLSDLPMYIMPEYLVLNLPSFSISLRFSTDRLVDISTMVETATRPLAQPVMHTSVQAAAVGTNIHVAHMGINTHQGEHDRMKFCSEPSGRGFLFIDAASCDSYLLCSYPIHEIALNAGFPNTLCFTSMERRDAREQARWGSSASSGSSGTNTRPFFPQTKMGGRRGSGVSRSALWVGSMGGISSALIGDSNSSRIGVRNVVLLQSPDNDGSLIIVSTTIPPTVDLRPDQSRISEIEQGVAKTVLCVPLDESVDASTRRIVRVEEASVDEISGKVCIVETTTVADRITNHSQVRCGLKLLEYA